VSYDFTLGFNPIPELYVVATILLISLVFIVRSRQKWLTKGLDIIKLISFLFFTFYLTWGFNYLNRSLEEQMGWSLANPTIEYLQTELANVTDELNLIRTKVQPINPEDFKGIEKEIRPALEAQLSEFGFKTWGSVRVRKIVSGFLLVWRTSGIYLPQTFEGHVDGGLYSLQWPFTLAHEMSHGYGITSEADCNFLAYLTCVSMTNPRMKYSGLFAYWRYLASELKLRDSTAYQVQRQQLSDQVIDDLKLVRRHIEEYPQLMPKYRDKMYNQYLKSNGISEGIKNYNKMVLLIKAYKRKE